MMLLLPAQNTLEYVSHYCHNDVIIACLEASKTLSIPSWFPIAHKDSLTAINELKLKPNVLKHNGFYMPACQLVAGLIFFR